MQDYTIGEDYKLPSLCKFYSGDLSPEVKLRSMTTEEEMKRVASVDHPYKNMSEIIDDCLIEGPTISSYDMCIGDYQYLLHKLRVVTYGPEYSIVNQCIYCGCDNQETINLDELDVLEYTEDLEKYREFTLPKTGKVVRLKVQTPRMLDRINERLVEFRKKTKGKDLADPTLIYTMSELIDTIDGKKPNLGVIEDWLRKLPMADTNMIIQCADKINTSIGIDTNIQCDCAVCGLGFTTALRTTADFFRPALQL